MAPLTWRRIAVIAACALVLAWIATEIMLRAGGTPAKVPWTVYAFVIAAGGSSLAFAWQVRQYLRGNKPGLSPLRAARTAIFAQACAYVGAILTGSYGGYAVGLLDGWGHAPRRAVILSAVFAAGAGAALVAAGWVAERWCRHGNDDPGPTREGVMPEPA